MQFFLITTIAAKVVGVYLVTRLFGSPNQEAMYTTPDVHAINLWDHLIGVWPVPWNHDKSQYSALVAAFNSL
jgi:glutathione-regulated potassium-efflux system ancillary protein KefC